MAKSEVVDIEMRIRREQSTIVAFADGTMTRNPMTGLEMEKWFWLPRRLIEVEITNDKTKDCIVTMPRWLAEDRGLV